MTSTPATTANSPVLSGIRTADIPDIWPFVAEMIADGLRSRGAPVNLPPVYDELRAGIRQLWLATSPGRGIEAALMTRVESDHAGRYCALKLVVGEEPERWTPLLKDIEAWALAHGCERITTEWTRTGWEKILPDYTAKRVWLEKELGE